MSTKAKTATVLSQADTESNALPWVRKPGLIPIMSWAVPLEGSALEQATNLSNLPFAIDHVALMPDAHTGYGMPIGGVLFADRAVVPYASASTSAATWRSSRRTGPSRHWRPTSSIESSRRSMRASSRRAPVTPRRGAP